MYIKKIGRRINTITCYGKRLRDNEFEDFCAVVITSENMPTLEDLTKHLRKRERDQTLVVNKIDVDSSYYKMSVEDFIQKAERTD